MDQTQLDTLLAKYGSRCYGVRLTYYSHVLRSCAYRTTADNLRMCIRALALLEGYADETEMAKAFDDDNVKIELYTSS